jgi:cellulose synthase/poly-beta-1,6-N-acetylglucosamine synthase-like glycosyltransferase
VLVRNDPTRRGKGYALDHAFRTLLAEGYNAFVVVDADTQVEANLLQSFADRFNAGADALQCLYRAPEDATSPAVRMRNIIWYAFNVLRPRARAAWGLSIGIYGNGFGVSRAALQRVPYDVGSITEDLDYHLRLVGAGLKVELVAETTVWSALPLSAAASESQRARWEGGRLAAILEWSPRLLRRILRGGWSATEPLLDLWLLPLSYHALLLLPLILIPNMSGRIYAAFGLFLLAFHAFTAVRLSGRWQDLTVLIRIPIYVVYKLGTLPKVLAKSRKNAAWIRTDRSTAGEKS